MLMKYNLLTIWSILVNWKNVPVGSNISKPAITPIVGKEEVGLPSAILIILVPIPVDWSMLASIGVLSIIKVWVLPSNTPSSIEFVKKLTR